MESKERIQLKKNPKESVSQDTRLHLKGFEKELLQYWDHATERLHFFNILSNNDNTN